MTATPERSLRRRSLVAIVLAVAIVAVGVVATVRGWLATGGPDGAVRGYFAALASEDAATALGYGAVPAGNRALLTDRVLQEQQRIAPIENVSATVRDESGDRARVGVQYTLAFAGGDHRVEADLGLHRVDGDWRLDRSAVPTQLLLEEAAQRASILGTALPSGTVDVFPGAAPITFDTPLLQLDPGNGFVAPDADTSTSVQAEPTAAARAQLTSLLRTSLRNCLGTSASARCPLPSERTVPGSVRGSLTGRLGSDVSIDLSTSAVGEFTLVGEARVRGDYRELEFDNTATAHTRQSFTLPVDMRAYAVSPLTLTGQRP